MQRINTKILIFLIIIDTFNDLDNIFNNSGRDKFKSTSNLKKNFIAKIYIYIIYILLHIFLQYFF